MPAPHQPHPTRLRDTLEPVAEVAAVLAWAAVCAALLFVGAGQ